jgi:tetratricopeptide (TPR) repeat protein
VLADRHPGEEPVAVAEACIGQHGWLWRPYEPAVQFTEPGLFGVARRAELDVLAPEDSPAAVRCYSRAALEARATGRWQLLPLDLQEAVLTTLLAAGGTVEQVQDERIQLTVELALTRQRTGRAESARHLAETLRDYQRTGRLSGIAVATCAEVLFDLDERQAARDVLRAEYDRLAADPEHGPDAPETLVALNNLAGVYHAAGELEPAVEVLREVLDRRTRVLGRTHAHTRAARCELAQALAEWYHFPQAVEQYEELYDDNVAALGRRHSETIIDAARLFALVCDEIGHPGEAAAELASLLIDAQAVFGSIHPYTLTFRNNLAVAYQAAGRLAEAIPLYERTLADRERVFGPEHPDTLTSRNNLAYADDAHLNLPRVAHRNCSP